MHEPVTVHPADALHNVQVSLREVGAIISLVNTTAKNRLSKLNRDRVRTMTDGDYARELEKLVMAMHAINRITDQVVTASAEEVLSENGGTHQGTSSDGPESSPDHLPEAPPVA